METALENADRSLKYVRRAIDSPNPVVECMGLSFGLPMWAIMIYCCELPAKQQDAFAALLREYGMTWSNADAVADTITHATMRKRGDKSMNQYAVACEDVGWQGRCAHILVSRDNAGLTALEIMEALPSIQELKETCRCFDAVTLTVAVHTYGSVFLILGASKF